MWGPLFGRTCLNPPLHKPHPRVFQNTDQSNSKTRCKYTTRISEKWPKRRYLGKVTVVDVGGKKQPCGGLVLVTHKFAEPRGDIQLCHHRLASFPAWLSTTKSTASRLKQLSTPLTTHSITDTYYTESTQQSTDLHQDQQLPETCNQLFSSTSAGGVAQTGTVHHTLLDDLKEEISLRLLQIFT